MVPDLPTVRDDGGGIDRSHKFLGTTIFDEGRPNGSNGSNGSAHGAHPNTGTNVQPEFAATKLISNGHPAENGFHHKPKDQLTSNGAFWPPLKAVPLASYYKLHRVPSVDSLSVMAEEQGGVQPIELPQSEPSHIEEPQDKSPPTNPPTNGVHNKLLEHVIRTPGRQPSPQPTHLSVRGPGQPRVLPEQGSGYIAPKFEGKEQQMDQGKVLLFSAQISTS